MPVDVLRTEAPRKCNTKKEISTHKSHHRKTQPRIEKSANHKTSFFICGCVSQLFGWVCCCVFLFAVVFLYLLL